MASLGNKVVNMGALSLLVKDIKLSSNIYGASPVSLSAAEATVLDGVTGGTATASKAVVLDSNANITGMGVRRAVIEDALAVTLTAAQSGGIVVLDKVDGVTVTLPAPIIGLWYDFQVDVASTSVGQKVITSAGTIFIKGTVLQMTAADAANVLDTANGSSHISVLLNGTTTGGCVGTRFRLTCRTATIWEVEGLIIASGSVATSFSAS